MRRLGNTALTMLLTLAVLMACQQEQIIINEPQGNTLDAMSPLADLVGQTALNDGSADNIIDHSSCITVVLPVSVIANGTELLIATPGDFVLIERIFDESSIDTDVLQIIYPIQVILPDHEVEEISSDSELAEVTEDCLEDGLDDDIECLDFKYPVTVSVYNSGSQSADIIEITNDASLYNFLESLDDNSVFSFNYPLTMILSDSSEVIVSSNDELEALIDEVDDSCDEDDDFDYNDDDADTSGIIGILKAKGWVVTYFFATNDQTSAFANYIFSFDEDDLALAFIDNTVIPGDWEVYGDAGTLEMELEFTEEFPLGMLEEEDWQIDFYDSTLIELSYEKEDGSMVYMTLEATDRPDSQSPTVSEYIVLGEWGVAMFKNDGVEATEEYLAYRINFTEDMKLTYYKETEIFEGTWEEIIELGEGHYLTLDFGSSIAVFELLNREWNVVSIAENRVELVSKDTDPEATDNLVLEKY